MELRHIRYFLAVAQEGNVTRAAEKLGIGQPPLSQQILALEREMGVQLFRRTGHGVSLTEAGESLLADAKRLLDDAREPRYIKTVRNEGYVFASTVEQGGAA